MFVLVIWSTFHGHLAAQKTFFFETENFHIFNVLLTVHLSIVLVVNQLNAQILVL
jgi:hypothetical protein